MATEDTCRSELTELVTYEVFCDEHWDPGLTVVNRDGKTDHVRDDHTASLVSLDHLLLTSFIRCFYPFQKTVVNKRAFLN